MHDVYSKMIFGNDAVATALGNEAVKRNAGVQAGTHYQDRYTLKRAECVWNNPEPVDRNSNSPEDEKARIWALNDMENIRAWACFPKLMIGIDTAEAKYMIVNSKPGSPMAGTQRIIVYKKRDKTTYTFWMNNSSMKFLGKKLREMRNRQRTDGYAMPNILMFSR